jgi:hypothetical protein
LQKHSTQFNWMIQLASQPKGITDSAWRICGIRATRREINRKCIHGCRELPTSLSGTIQTETKKNRWGSLTWLKWIASIFICQKNQATIKSKQNPVALADRITDRTLFTQKGSSSKWDWLVVLFMKGSLKKKMSQILCDYEVCLQVIHFCHLGHYVIESGEYQNVPEIETLHSQCRIVERLK